MSVSEINPNEDRPLHIFYIKDEFLEKLSNIFVTGLLQYQWISVAMNS